MSELFVPGYCSARERRPVARLRVNATTLLSMFALPAETKITHAMLDPERLDTVLLNITSPGLQDVMPGMSIPEVTPDLAVEYTPKMVFRGWGQTEAEPDSVDD